MTLSFLKVISQPVNLDFSAGNINGWSIQKANNLDSYLMSVSAYSASTEYSVMTQAGASEINNIPLSMGLSSAYIV